MPLNLETQLAICFIIQGRLGLHVPLIPQLDEELIGVVIVAVGSLDQDVLWVYVAMHKLPLCEGGDNGSHLLSEQNHIIPAFNYLTYTGCKVGMVELFREGVDPLVGGVGIKVDQCHRKSQRMAHGRSILSTDQIKQVCLSKEVPGAHVVVLENVAGQKFQAYWFFCVFV